MVLYRGESRGTFAIDVGSEMTAISWQELLHDEEVQEPNLVGGWLPSDPHKVKFPSSILYRGKTPIHFGYAAESMADEEPHSRLVKGFKLALHPLHMQDQACKALPGVDAVASQQYQKPVLPTDITEVYRIFYTYVLEHTRDVYIKARENGQRQWQDLIASAHFVLPHPNGWTAVEQDVLKSPCLVRYSVGTNHKSPL